MWSDVLVDFTGIVFSNEFHFNADSGVWSPFVLDWLVCTDNWVVFFVHWLELSWYAVDSEYDRRMYSILNVWKVSQYVIILKFDIDLELAKLESQR